MRKHILQAISADLQRISLQRRPSALALHEAAALYKRLFWRAYLGVRAYALYDAMAAHVTAVAYGYADARYRFGVLLNLPTLTPGQAAQLPGTWGEAHNYFLGALRGFDLVAWRDLRVDSLVPDAIERYGWTWFEAADQEDVGQTAILGSTFQAVMARDRHQCRYCSQAADQVDFVIPSSQGGTDALSNLAAICEGCRLLKGNRTPAQAGLLLLPAP